MPNREPHQTKNLDRYGNAALPWSRVLTALVDSPGGPEVTWFLGVTNRDGSPHAAGVGALWSDGEFYFVSGPTTRKSKALAARPAATLSGRMAGIDLVFEGPSRRITDHSTLERIVALYQQQGWPAGVANDALTAPYSAPSAGPPPWYLYRLEYEVVYGVATVDPAGATRWRFRD